MKVYYFGNFQKNRTEYWIAEALQKKVTLKRGNLKKLNSKEYAEIVLDVKNFNPDVVLFGKVQQGTPVGEAFRTINKLYPTVSWVFDLYFDLPKGLTRRTNELHFQADLVLTTDGGHKEEWKKEGIKHKTLRQGIYMPEHKLYKRRKVRDLLFVGGIYNAQRASFFEEMKFLYGDRLLMVGDQEQIRGPELNKLIAESKIIIGDSAPSDNYWSNRLYEMTGRGGFLLFPEIKGLSREFKKSEVPTYEWNNPFSLIEKIEYYLKNEKEREKVRAAGFTRCGQYTYDNRVKELIKHMKCLAGKK